MRCQIKKELSAPLSAPESYFVVLLSYTQFFICYKVLFGCYTFTAIILFRIFIYFSFFLLTKKYVSAKIELKLILVGGCYGLYHKRYGNPC